MSKKSNRLSTANKEKQAQFKSKKPSPRGDSIELLLTKIGLLNALAETANLTKKPVKDLFGSLEDIITSHFKKQGLQQFILPGLLKKYWLNITLLLKHAKTQIHLLEKK